MKFSSSVAAAWHSLRFAYRAALVTLLLCFFFMAAGVLALRYWILPNADHFRADVAAIAGEKLGQRITVDRMAAEWDGLRPRLVMREVRVFDRAGQPALVLGTVAATLGWSSLLHLDLRLREVTLEASTLNVRRDPAGRLFVAGLPLSQTEGDGKFSGWLLRQREVLVRGAAIVWQDELRSAPELRLQQVALRLSSRGSRHRFALRASPPAALAGQLDLRGDLAVRPPGRIEDWSGQLYARLSGVDLAAWRAWVEIPVVLSRGTGAVRVWLDLDRGAPRAITADVRLAGVLTRLGEKLPELDLTRLDGRIAWKQADGAMEIATRRLALVTGRGLRVDPTDFVLKSAAARPDAPARGVVRANALDLGVLNALSGYLPLPEAARQRLAELNPHGRLLDLSGEWTGDLPQPAHFALRSRFEALALKPSGIAPGFSGLSGSVDGDDQRGVFTLASRGASVDLPRVFRQPLTFSTFTAQAAWTRRGGDTEIKFSNVAFANPHLAGNGFVTYVTATQGPGTLDLSGTITRADGPQLRRYLPRVLSQDTYDWLERSLLSGNVSEGRVRVKGDLRDFPFPDDRRGQLEATARLDSVTLAYGAPHWPPIENMAGSLAFRGNRVEVNADRATVLGARLSGVRAVIPDLSAPEEILQVSGQAEGAVSEFLRFVRQSPVFEATDRFSEDFEASGQGRLALDLTVPLGGEGRTQVKGVFQFLNNGVSVKGVPVAMEQVNGSLGFDRSSVTVRNLQARILGGPARIDAVVPAGGGVLITAAGRIDADALRDNLPHPLLRHLRGGTDWKATVPVKGRVAEVVLESSLAGLASDLPAPLGKSAEESLPVRLEKKVAGPGQGLVSVSLGRLVSARWLQREDANGFRIERGVVNFGEPPPPAPPPGGEGSMPPTSARSGRPPPALSALGAGSGERAGRKGLWLTGALPLLDLDRWLDLSQELDTGGGSGAVAGLDLRIGRLIALGKPFSEVTVSGVAEAPGVRLDLEGRDLAGEVRWDGQSPGRVVARLRHLILSGDASIARGPGTPRQETRLPALDVIVDEFAMDKRQLGRLELNAVNRGAEWQIGKFSLANPDFTFDSKGVWRLPGGTAAAEARLDTRLEIKDLGRMLARLDHPEVVKGGSGTLEGMLTWSGSVFEPDYPTLTGELTVKLTKGQFVKVEPGVGKLLGVLSLQALPRRISLDFRDLFSDGFAFDEISGTAQVTRGVAHTEDLKIAGASARVSMKGDLGLARESQQLHVRVVPTLTETAALATGMLGGPIVGIATYVLSKALKDPFEQLAAYEYNISGTWSDPVVTKVERPAPSITPSGE